MKKLTPKTNSYHYPKGNKGIGTMIERIIEQVKRAGINLITSETVAKISSSRDQITSVQLKKERLLLIVTICFGVCRQP